MSGDGVLALTHALFQRCCMSMGSNVTHLDDVFSLLAMH